MTEGLLLEALASYLEERGIFHSQGVFLEMIDAEIERVQKSFRITPEKKKAEKTSPKKEKMTIVTLDGRIMNPGEDGDYVLDDEGVPRFKNQRLHYDTVVQVICPSEDSRRVYIGNLVAEEP